MKIKTGVIVKVILVSLFIWYVSYGIKRCHEEGDVVKLEFNEFNPQIYDLPFNIDSIANVIENYRFGAYNIRERNGFDFTLYVNFNQSSYIYVYRNNPWKRVRGGYYLSVKLFPLSKDLTRVTVRNIDNIVSYGVKLWKGPTFEHYYFKDHYVKTPAIQEYDFLRLLGKQLGYLKNMPFTKYPKELSQKQILFRFGKNMPFEVNEIFEYPEEGLEEWYKQDNRNF